MKMSPAPCLIALAVLVGFTGCTTLTVEEPSGPFPSITARQRLEVQQTLAASGNSAFWREVPASHANAPGGAVVYLDEQRAYFLKGDLIVGTTRVATGKAGYRTPPGSYQVIQFSPNHVSNLYGDYVDEEGNVLMKDVTNGKTPLPEGATFAGSRMPWFVRFADPQGNWTGYGFHQGRVPNHPASHGCIRVPSASSKRVYDFCKMRMPVRIVAEAPAMPETTPRRSRE